MTTLLLFGNTPSCWTMIYKVLKFLPVLLTVPPVLTTPLQQLSCNDWSLRFIATATSTIAKCMCLESAGYALGSCRTSICLAGLGTALAAVALCWLQVSKASANAVDQLVLMHLRTAVCAALSSKAACQPLSMHSMSDTQDACSGVRIIDSG